MMKKSANLTKFILDFIDESQNNRSEFVPILSNSRFQETLLNYADINGLYYAVAQTIKQLGIPLLKPERFSLELKQIAEIKTTIEILNSISSEYGVKYILIKDINNVQNVARDVDILIHKADWDIMKNALFERGFTIIHDNPAEISFEARGCRRVDIYNGISYFHKDFIRSNRLWGSIEIHTTHGVSHPGLSCSLSLLVNSIHGIFGHPYLSLLDYISFLRSISDKTIVDNSIKIANELGWSRLFERWIERIQVFNDRIEKQGRFLRFPVRNGISFTLDCVTMIEDIDFASRAKFAMAINLIWDDLLFVANKSGIGPRFKSSMILPIMTNRLGHSLRLLRGDSKY